jgi:SAM-dependent methyltransferase
MRTPERLRAHYEIEKDLAARLRQAPRAERRRLYAALYDELFRRVPDHPQLQGKTAPQLRGLEVAWQLGLLSRFLKPETRFLELGPGDCAVTLAVAARVQSAWGVDVSDEITRRDRISVPANFRLVLSDGISVPVPPASIDVAYSNQLIEHLHPDDAAEQVKGVFDALAPGGVYLCITPNRLTGPHDVSETFDSVATGLHLREYTTSELSTLLRRAGFAATRAMVGPFRHAAHVPIATVAAIEALIGLLPHRARRSLGETPPVRSVLGVRVLAWK